MKATEIKEKVAAVGVCAWCLFEYDPETFERIRHLSDEEYERLSRDTGASHGCCGQCGEQLLAESEAYRTEYNSVDLDRDRADALDRADAQDSLARAVSTHLILAAGRIEQGGNRQVKFTGPTNGRTIKSKENREP